MLAFGVTLWTARDQIALGRFTTANNRHQMIHGQFFWLEAPAAMMAKPGGALALPPWAGAQLARLLPFAANLLFGNFDQERRRFHERGYFKTRLFQLVQSVEIFEINTEAHGHYQVQPRSHHRPKTAARKIIPQLPGGEKTEKHRRAGDENFMRRHQLHSYASTQPHPARPAQAWHRRVAARANPAISSSRAEEKNHAEESHQHGESAQGHRPLRTGNPGRRFRLRFRADSARSENRQSRRGRHRRSNPPRDGKPQGCSGGRRLLTRSGRQSHGVFEEHRRFQRHERSLRRVSRPCQTGALHGRGGGFAARRAGRNRSDRARIECRSQSPRIIRTRLCNTSFAASARLLPTSSALSSSTPRG